MDYNKNTDKFSCSTENNWTSHLKRFMDLCLEYNTDSDICLRHFRHSIFDTSQTYNYDLSLMENRVIPGGVFRQPFKIDIIAFPEELD